VLAPIAEILQQQIKHLHRFSHFCLGHCAEKRNSASHVTHRWRELDSNLAARRYLAPLIVGEAYPPFKNGLPDYVKLQNVAAPKKLTTEFVV
jgi:hypothetical protein